MKGRVSGDWKFRTGDDGKTWTRGDITIRKHPESTRFTVLRDGWFKGIEGSWNDAADLADRLEDDDGTA
jgi:hypothetical protein